MRLVDLFETKQDLHELATEFMKDAAKNMKNWFGTGTFDALCSEAGNCAMVSEQFIDWLHEKGIGAKSLTVYMAKNPMWAKRAGVTSGSGDDAHTAVLVGDMVVDFTVRQFDPKLPYPRIIPMHAFKDEWHH